MLFKWPVLELRFLYSVILELYSSDFTWVILWESWLFRKFETTVIETISIAWANWSILDDTITCSNALKCLEIGSLRACLDCISIKHFNHFIRFIDIHKTTVHIQIRGWWNSFAELQVYLFREKQCRTNLLGAQSMKNGALQNGAGTFHAVESDITSL